MTKRKQPSKNLSLARRARAVVFRERLGGIMAVYLLVAVTIALLSPLIAPHDPLTLGLANPHAPASADHLLGTDDLGRDTLSRLMYGARLSFAASFLAVGVAMLIALPLGLFAGYFGGWLDAILMRVLDIQMALPGLVLVIAIASALGGGLTNAMIALSLAFVPILARVVRAETLAVREESFIEASRSIGTSTPRILASRVLRNVAPPLLVQTTITMGQAMSAEAALSFLGLGAQPPQASWGAILRRSYDSIFIAPYSILAPALLIVFTAWAFNAVGDSFGESLGSRSASQRKGFTVLTEAAANRPDRDKVSEPDLLDVDNLSVGVQIDDEFRRLVDDISFGVAEGRVLGIVGESGSGKSVTAMSLTRLFASPPALISTGDVRYRGESLLAMDFAAMRRLRGSEISMIFQNPKASLNPALTVGQQIDEVLRWHGDLDRKAARLGTAQLLARVGVPSERASSYPHQLSGGMCQRVMMAMALAGQPALLVADEPTSALDVTVQAEVLDLLHELKRAGLSILLITHDFGVVADICDDVLVMYAGEVVERGPVTEVLDHPAHPYTRALLNALPGSHSPGTRLAAIEGNIPAAGSHVGGCRFAARCSLTQPDCLEVDVPLDAWREGARTSRCLHVAAVDPVFVPGPATLDGPAR